MLSAIAIVILILYIIVLILLYKTDCESASNFVVMYMCVLGFTFMRQVTNKSRGSVIVVFSLC